MTTVDYGIKPDMTWADQGACKDHPHEDWFPYYGMSSNQWKGTARARIVCRTCPVLHECREHAILHEPFGTWGGMTAEERDIYRKRHNVPAPYGARRLRADYTA